MLNRFLSMFNGVATKTGGTGLVVIVLTLCQIYLSMHGIVPEVNPTTTTTAPSVLPTDGVAELLAKLPAGWQYGAIALLFVFMRMSNAKQDQQLAELHEKIDRLLVAKKK